MSERIANGDIEMREFLGKQLVLVPTPIDEESPLEQTAFEVLKKAADDPENNLILIEDLKPGRRRWLRWGLQREAIENFFLFNEHTQEKSLLEVMSHLHKGKTIYLMSDGGLPAFCDPGQKLVRQCHLEKIKVTSLPFSNSISLAVALSGIDCRNFYFAGFLAKNSDERRNRLVQLDKMETPIVLMDTPYRLKKLLDEIGSVNSKRKVFLGIDLNQSSEELYYGKISNILKHLKDLKREFILIWE